MQGTVCIVMIQPIWVKVQCLFCCIMSQFHLQTVCTLNRRFVFHKQWDNKPEEVVSSCFVKTAAFVRTPLNVFHFSPISHFTFQPHFFSTDKVVPLQCACENVYDCVNNTCWGNYCYHTLNNEVEKRGCFQTFEQCHVPDISGLYCKCCFYHFCNENSTVPAKGQ